MKQPSAKVAIITRTKDRGILLERAIKSVHQQTMDDFVHVIINDAGDPEVVDGLVEKYKDLIQGRVKVIHNTISHGMEAASNKAIKSVDSTFVAIHDDDDTWHPDFLEKTTEHLESTRAMGVVVTTDRINEEIIGKSVQTKSVERWMPHVHVINLYQQCLDNHMTPITFIYRREAFDEVGYYDESLPVCGDWDFGIRFLAKYDVDFLESEPALAYYHHRPYIVGSPASSIFGGNNLHEVYLNKLLNKYLRNDIAEGTFGIGYLMNSIRNEQYNTQRILNNIDEKTVRIEGHINYTAEEYTRSSFRKLARRIKVIIKGTKQ